MDLVLRSGSSISTIRDIIGENYYKDYELPKDQPDSGEGNSGDEEEVDNDELYKETFKNKFFQYQEKITPRVCFF